MRQVGWVGQVGRAGLVGLVGLLCGMPTGAQQNANPLTPYITVPAGIILLTHARVIDGTGAGPREDQTIEVRGGNIVAIGSASSRAPAAGATVIDLTGKSVL